MHLTCLSELLGSIHGSYKIFHLLFTYLAYFPFSPALFHDTDFLDPASIFQKDFSQYSIVVFAVGSWDYFQKFECGASGIGNRNATEDFLGGFGGTIE